MPVPTEACPAEGPMLALPVPARRGVEEDAAARSWRRRHREMLVIALVVTFLPFILDVRPDQRVAFHGLSQLPMPETCMVRSTFGGTCPGCGLTRSFIYLAHGDWQRSLALHRLGWLLAAAVLLQFPYRLFCLWRGDRSAALRTAARWFGYTLVFLLVGNWLCELIFTC